MSVQNGPKISILILTDYQRKKINFKLIPLLQLKGLGLCGPPCIFSRRFIRRESSESRVLSAIIESARGNSDSATSVNLA